MKTTTTLMTMNKPQMVFPMFPLSRFSIMPRTDQAPYHLRVMEWREIVLDLNAVCAHCNDILKKGRRAAVAAVEENGLKPAICLNCLKEINHENRRHSDKR
ncbi:MAG: hypothetical protein AB1724_17075 [Thermodesulfobacteriota bacterium]